MRKLSRPKSEGCNSGCFSRCSALHEFQLPYHDLCSLCAMLVGSALQRKAFRGLFLS
jgi:hypothetical protein